jgi:hypothetical protein
MRTWKASLFTLLLAVCIGVLASWQSPTPAVAGGYCDLTTECGANPYLNCVFDDCCDWVGYCASWGMYRHRVYSSKYANCSYRCLLGESCVVECIPS